jgi:hypothetical protein
MIRCALLIWVTLVVATCFGCALAPSPVPLSPIACAAITNVGVVPTSFDPTSATGTPPASGPAPANIQADLLAAYNAAPAYFQTQLCGLDGIFVTAGSQSWGYRNINDGRRYIAISMSLWSPSGPITLDQYQNRVFGPPLSWRSSTDPSPPTYLPATPNDGTMTVLAALAHEFGHVFWSDTLVFPRGTHPQSSRFCNRILNDAWNGALQPAVWKNFEDLDSNPADIPDDPSDPPQSGDPGPGHAKVLKMMQALQSGHIRQAHRILWRVLALGRPFPSLLAAFSANEQFVETFTLYTLLHGQTPLTSLPLQISPALVRDVPASLPGRKRLTKLLKCFDSIVPSSRR